MSYSYVVTAQKSTCVSRSITGNFTGPNEVNLIISKCTRLEIHTLTPEGLQPFLDIGIYGRISTLQLFRPPTEDKDLLFIATERYKFCILAYDSKTGEIVTRANGDIHDVTGKPAEHSQIGIIDPDSRVIALHLYTGWIKLIPIDSTGKLNDAYNIRLDELYVIDIQFLHGCAQPTIVVLHQDVREERHISVYEIVLDDKELLKGNWSTPNVESAASMLIPVPAPYGGVIVVGEMTISYMNGKSNTIIGIEPANMMAYGKVDPDGSRYLLGDLKGQLYILLLQNDGKNITGLKLEKLGRVSIPSTLSYLDNRVVFVGSAYGDSQLIKLKTERDSEGNYLEYLDSFTNLGPIVDFSVVDLDRQGQSQVVTCSGAFKDGSLRIIRNGIGINEQATIELPGVKGIWSLKSFQKQFDKYLVVSFVKQTRFLAITDEEIDEIEMSGFNSGEQTLFCCNLFRDRILQVTESQVRVVSTENFALLDSWNPPTGDLINIASANATQAVLAVGGNRLIYLDFSGESHISQVATTSIEHEIACVNINPLQGADRADFCAVGLWNDISVRLFKLPSLEQVAKEILGGEFLPRSVLLTSFESQDYLFCAMGDGHFYSFKFTPETCALHDRKKMSLGTRPVLLNTFESKNASHVFAVSDRPTVIYSSNKKLFYSTINLKEVDCICSFNTEAFPDSLAIASEGNLMIGTIDEIQKLHIRTVPLGEMPRRITYHESSQSFGVVVLHFGVNEAGADVESSYVRLLDDASFDIQDSYQFKDLETGCSIASVRFSSDPTEYIVVGTAVSRPDEAQPKEGRILVFSVLENKKLQLVCEKLINGAAFCLSEFSGKLLVGINNIVGLYSWDGSCNLVEESHCGGNILVTGLATQGNTIIVTDLLRSISVIHYNSVESKLQELARDYTSRWMTGAELLTDESFIGAENQYNLFTLTKNPEAESQEERSRLELAGQYHLGEIVNKIRHASLLMKPAEGEAPLIPTTIFGTVTGSIGVIASISKEDFEFFDQVQNSINGVIKGVGGLNHAEWRSFLGNGGSSPAQGFIDGDLIESFLDLKPEKMAAVVQNLGISPEELCKRIEELAQAIH